MLILRDIDAVPKNQFVAGQVRIARHRIERDTACNVHAPLQTKQQLTECSTRIDDRAAAVHALKGFYGARPAPDLGDP